MDTVFITDIPKNSMKYLESAWSLKNEIENETNLLQQEWYNFKQVYKDSEVYLAINEKNEVLGFACIIKNSYLSILAVDINHQRKGIGKHIVNTIKNEYSYLYCHSRKSNTDSHEFYKKLNFDKTSTAKNYYKDHEDAYVFTYYD